ncbi:hypothetical protein SAMN00017477_0864 [Peptoniphilus asaccharolyticus DSM 20463]|uniref:N-acetylmuramoyl-L-alanine amidase n=1 Tax=Peptoniphilus asaccharolyticus DSM 20463 TaxID=573058 RepID=A0A1W1UYN5_PEPAS|nr:hypothetical protein SAMN00017477_0864 [Peptoniphilus asaccharolyticus DSM 20463]
MKIMLDPGHGGGLIEQFKEITGEDFYEVRSWK